MSHQDANAKLLIVCLHRKGFVVLLAEASHFVLNNVFQRLNAHSIYISQVSLSFFDEALNDISCGASYASTATTWYHCHVSCVAFGNWELGGIF